MSLWRSALIPWDSPTHLIVWTLIAIAVAVLAHILERAWKQGRRS